MSDVARILVERCELVEVARIVSLDWYDGPREGFVWLSEPRSAWYFTLWAEAPSSEDVDDRLYALARLPDDGERIIETLLAPLDLPSDRLHWVPHWWSHSKEQRTAAHGVLDALIERLEAPSVLVRSPFLDRFAAAWLIARPRRRSLTSGESHIRNDQPRPDGLDPA